MANISRLGVILGLDTAEFQQALKSARRNLDDFAAKIPAMAAVGVAAFTAMSVKAMQMADQMSDLADATDMSIASILQISEALEMSGGKADGATKVLTKFYQTLDDAAQGSKTAQEAFTRIGVSLKDLSDPNAENIFRKTVDNIAAMGDKAGQTGAAVALFGKGIKGVNMSGFAEELHKSNSEFQKQQDAVKQAADLHDKFAKKVFQTNLIFTQNLMPTLNAFYDKIMVDGGLAENVFSALNKILVGTYYAFANAGIAMEQMYNGAKDFLTLDWGQTGEKLNRDNELILKQVALRKEAYDLLNPKTPPSSGGGFDGTRTIKPPKDDATKLNQLLKELRAIEEITEKYKTSLQYEVEGINLKTKMVFMTQDQQQIEQAMYDLRKKSAEQIAQLEDKKKIAQETHADRRVIEMLDEQIAKINETTEAYKTQITSAIEYQQQVEQSYFGGLGLSYKKYQEMAINNAQTVESMVDSLYGNMTNAIDQFVQAGKFKFSDFANSVIKDLLRIAIQAQATKLFSQLLGGVMGAVGGANASIAGNPTSDQIEGFANFWGTPSATTSQADGGDITAGMPYYVGENGPELVVPNRNGTVIPNNKLGGLGGNQPQTVFNGPYIASMSAIDTQSAMQFLAKNKMAVYSANMSATRSIPTSVR